MTDTTARLAEFLRLVADGYSQREAARAAGVSRETVFRRKRSHPEFAAELHAAERSSSLVWAERRDRHYRARFLALATENAEKDYRKTTKRERRIWHRWRGEWLDSELPAGDDPLSQAVRNDIKARQQASFAKRRAEKRGAPAESDRREHSPATPKKGKAGVLF
jgi:transposase